MKKQLTANRTGIMLSQKLRRESWLPEDKEWLNNNPQIKLGSKINKGKNGAVWKIEGNDNLIAKLPIGLFDDDKYTTRDIDGLTKHYRKAIEDELETHKKFNLEELPLFTPTTVHDLGIRTKSGKPYIALIRPKVNVVNDNTYEDNKNLSGAKKITDKQLEIIRQALISWSYKGIYPFDDLQIGIDKVGRMIQYDSGFLQHTSNIEKAFSENNNHWINFLIDIGKIKDKRKSSISIGLNKYGSVETK